MKFRNVQQIASWRLCVGCGACIFACPEKNIELVDFENEGLRPVIKGNHCETCVECVNVCPGWEIGNPRGEDRGGIIKELQEGFGPVLEVWEGFAKEPDIRFLGSSGGTSTALSLYCLERERMGGVIHSGPDGDRPWKNRSTISLRREDLLPRTGSRYGPASVCDGLGAAASLPSPCVFIGKPCDVEGVRKIQAVKPELTGKVGVAIGIFCAGTPSTHGTLELLKKMGVDPESVDKIRYRGKGWPGKFSVKLKGEAGNCREISYQDSWGFLQKYRPFRCYLCPDGTAEFADISCGDPWYRELKENDIGYSLVLVRTERGREIVRGAMEMGYVVLEQADPEILARSQKNLLGKRREIWGRLLALKMFGIPAPKYNGFPLYQNWKELTIKDKARSILGTVRRIIQRKYYIPLKHDSKVRTNREEVLFADRESVPTGKGFPK